MSENYQIYSEKIDLWAKTLNLFHKYNEFIGPFYEAGYIDLIYQVEAKRDRKSFVSIDILATNEGKKQCCGIELTTNDGIDKDAQLSRYTDLTPNEIGNQFGKTTAHPMDAILSTNHKNSTEFPHIICTDTYHVRNIDKLKDRSLKKSLSKIKDVKINAPQPKFTIPPEAKNYEICIGLVPLIYKIIASNAEYDDEGLVKGGLDYLYDNLSYEHKRILKNGIAKEMDRLIKYLPNDLGKKNNKYYNLNPNGNAHPKKLEKIDGKIREWINSSNHEQLNLDAF